MARFRSEAGQAAYRMAYDRMLVRWPSPAATRIVPGRIADTHVIEAGQPDGTPLILLPAVSVSAVAFLPLIAHLTGRRVIAADVPGDAGFSVPHRPIGGIDDLSDWLAELIGALGVEQRAVAGHSYGGWIALGTAALRGEALGPITLIAPASGLVPFRWHMALFLRVAQYLPLGPSARAVLRAQAAPGWTPDPDFVDLMDAMTRHLKTEVPFPSTFDDTMLASIRGPLRVLLAEREVLYDPSRAAARAKTIKNASVRILAGAGHLLPMEKPAEVAEAIL